MKTSTAREAGARQYRSYLIRLWCETPDRRWQASLEDPGTGKRIGFASLEQLFVYLMEQVDGDTQGAGQSS
jgi:hypothetical protein